MSDSQNGEISDLNARSDADWDVDIPTWWKAHYREKLTSGQFSCQDIMLDLIHEFIVPLQTMRGYAELIRDHLPPSPPIILSTGEARTSRDFAEVILKFAARQQMMFNFARFEAWENPPNEEQNFQ
jgi:hypothetical protein